MKEKGTCYICGDTYEHFGNNPDPLPHGKDDRACGFCDKMFVVPARLGADMPPSSAAYRRLAMVLKECGVDNVSKLLSVYQMLSAQPTNRGE